MTHLLYLSTQSEEFIFSVSQRRFFISSDQSLQSTRGDLVGTFFNESPRLSSGESYECEQRQSSLSINERDLLS